MFYNVYLITKFLKRKLYILNLQVICVALFKFYENNSLYGDKKMAGSLARMRLITVKMPEIYVEGLDELVKIGRYSSRSEVIRVAIRDLLKKELWIKEAELRIAP